MKLIKFANNINKVKPFSNRLSLLNCNRFNNHQQILDITKRGFTSESSSGVNRYSDSGDNITRGKDYNDIYKSFKWVIPEYFNIGAEILDKHIDQGKSNHTAIKFINDSGDTINYTFGDIQRLSNILALALRDFGIEKGDRVGVLLTQGVETVISHSALFRSGMISIPLFTLFGPEALEYRLSNSTSSCLLTDVDNTKKLKNILPSLLPHLKKIVVFNTHDTNLKNDREYNDLKSQYPGLIVDWSDLKSQYSGKADSFRPVKSKADDPAVIIFTSGTTGNPKGCLHAHRVLLGHLPGVQFPQNLFPIPKKGVDYLFYTPADWAWIGGLLDVLLPSLYYGVPVLAHRFPKFDPIKLANIMREQKVTTCFLPPTALKMMRQNSKVPQDGYSLQSIGSGGESLGDKLLDWGRETFGVTINEFYGQTEANLLVGNCSDVFTVKSGSMGRAIPGHKVEVIDKDGNVVPESVVGDIAVKRPDPVIFLKYWNNEEATKKKFVKDWLVTGDLGKKDKEGYLWYTSRDDDLINSSGYRIGPSEIEHCLLRHPAVAMSGVIGVPDEVRGEIVKAYIVLKPDYPASTQLSNEIAEFVKKNLAAHEYPRLIEFINELPMTTTGKIIRKELRTMSASKNMKK